MNLFIISSIGAFLSSVCFIVFLFLNGGNNKSCKSLILLIICAGFWCLFPLFAVAGIPDKSLIFSRLIYIAAIFTAPSLLKFGLTILDLEREKKGKSLIRISFLISFLIFLPFLFSPLFINEVILFKPYFGIVGGPLYYLFILFFGVICSYCFYKIYSAYKQSTGFRKNQLKYVFIGFLFAFLSGLIHFSVSFNVPEIFPHDILVILCMLALIYSIIRHRLMDIKVAITKTGVFVFVYTIVLGLPIGITAAYEDWLIQALGKHWWVASLGLMAVLSTIGPFVYIYLEKRAEDKLLKEQRTYQQTLKQAAIGMTRIRDLKRLLDLIAHIVTSTVKISYIGIYLYDENNQEYVLEVIRDKGRVPLLRINSDNQLLLWIKKNRQAIVYEEIKRKMYEFGGEIYRQLEENMRLLTASVIVPCLLEDKFIGFFVLGDKNSGDIYTTDDLNVFQVLASQAALAIENARFYEETKKMQEQIAQAEKMATIGTMADGLSHQINNRFHAISLIAADTIDTIKITDIAECSNEVKQIFGQVNHALHRIETNVLQGAQVVSGILKYTRKGEKGMEPLTLDQILDAALDMVQYKVKLSEVDIVRDYTNDLPRIIGNLVQLQEVSFNFIDNAHYAIAERRNFLKEQGYRGRIVVSARVKDSEMIEVIMEDNGIGIKNEDIKKVFTPFFTTKVSSRKGTGLGLYVIKRIITENHKGRISFESDYQIGTRFIIDLPIAK